jgi:hypothetical protein
VWARETGQQCLMLKVDFDKAYDHVDWYFIFEMPSCLGLDSLCVAMMNTLFTDGSTFASVNNFLSLRIALDPFFRGALWLLIYLLTIDALDYFLEVVHIAGKVRGILLLDDLEMVNNHFAYGYLLSASVD